MFSSAKWSAMKNASNLPRSSVCAYCARCLKLKFASGVDPGYRHQAVWMLTGAHERTKVKLPGHQPAAWRVGAATLAMISPNGPR